MSELTQRFLMSVLVVACFVITGCGKSDEGSAAAPAAKPAAEATTAAPAAAEEAEFDISTIEKAEGVVYQDEIYANWPYN